MTRLVGWLGNPFRTEAAAFRWMVAIVLVVAFLTLLALALR